MEEQSVLPICNHFIQNLLLGRNKYQLIESAGLKRMPETHHNPKILCFRWVDKWLIRIPWNRQMYGVWKHNENRPCMFLHMMTNWNNETTTRKGLYFPTSKWIFSVGILLTDHHQYSRLLNVVPTHNRSVYDKTMLPLKLFFLTVSVPCARVT